MAHSPIKLYFFHMPGCSACEEAAPHLKQFARANKQIRVVKVDLSKVVLQEGRWQPEATPTYVLQRPGKEVNIFAGGMTMEELSAWINRKLGHQKDAEVVNGDDDDGADYGSAEHREEG
jgi:thioredoxin-like negative regulator of GroEL